MLKRILDYLIKSLPKGVKNTISSAFFNIYSFIPKSDIRILTDTISNEINSYSKICYESEIKTIFMMFKTYLKATYESFAKDSKSEESKEIILEFYRSYVNKTLIGEI